MVALECAQASRMGHTLAMSRCSLHLAKIKLALLELVLRYEADSSGRYAAYLARSFFCFSAARELIMAWQLREIKAGDIRKAPAVGTTVPCERLFVTESMSLII